MLSNNIKPIHIHEGGIQDVSTFNRTLALGMHAAENSALEIVGRKEKTN